MYSLSLTIFYVMSLCAYFFIDEFMFIQYIIEKISSIFIQKKNFINKIIYFLYFFVFIFIFCIYIDIIFFFLIYK